MATVKTYSVAGTSSLNGITKIRFANDFVTRFKALIKHDHEAINLIELGGEFTKAQICQVLLAHPDFQDEYQQYAITEYVVRNVKELKEELNETQTEEVPF
jgi:hypothetical protein